MGANDLNSNATIATFVVRVLDVVLDKEVVLDEDVLLDVDGGAVVGGGGCGDVLGDVIGVVV